MDERTDEGCGLCWEEGMIVVGDDVAGPRSAVMEDE